jgi:hypothetical protein
MTADGKLGRTRILTDSARKRIWKEVLARINIGHQHDRWMKLKEALRVQTHAEVAEKLLTGKHKKCKHQ